jgi:hypothetical protein
VAVDTVIRELVSVGDFPANREKYREDRHVTDLVHTRFDELLRDFAKLRILAASFRCAKQGDNRVEAGSAGDVAGSWPFHIRT